MVTGKWSSKSGNHNAPLPGCIPEHQEIREIKDASEIIKYWIHLANLIHYIIIELLKKNIISGSI